MHVLVTGVHGHLGSQVAAALAAAGHQVRGADFLVTNLAGVDCFAGDMTDYAICRELVANMDVVVHLGAYHGVHLPNADNPQGKNEQEFFAANVVGTFNLMQAAVEKAVPRLIWASSTVVFERYWAAYGIYSVSKRIGELLCDYYHTAHGLEIVALRYGGFVPIDFVTRGFGMLETWIEPEEAVKATVAAVTNTTIKRGFFDVQTPLPFTLADVERYARGEKLAVLTGYWPQHARLLRQHEARLPDQIFLSDVDETQACLGFRIERDFGWFLDELRRLG